MGFKICLFNQRKDYCIFNKQIEWCLEQHAAVIGAKHIFKFNSIILFI